MRKPATIATVLLLALPATAAADVSAFHPPANAKPVQAPWNRQYAAKAARDVADLFDDRLGQVRCKVQKRTSVCVVHLLGAVPMHLRIAMFRTQEYVVVSARIV